jgi:mannose-6-phosphate isomerase-like protein (cupin superfamily)
LSPKTEKSGFGLKPIYSMDTNQHHIFTRIENLLVAAGYTFERKDFNRPWGGFFVIDEGQTDRFVSEYFTDMPADYNKDGLKISPKILIVAPGKRLSWQYHHRRSEIWQVAQGEVGIVRSDTDEEQEAKTYTVGDKIELAQGERHRLIGLDDWGVVAEVWIHTDKGQPSDENDIVRLQDDFDRKTPESST